MSVTSEKLMEIVEELGLQTEQMSAFHKVAAGSRAVYIARTKKVSRVDLSGFDIKHPAVKRISEAEAREMKLGKVRGQIDFSKSEEKVLEGFRSALEMMLHLAEVAETDGTSEEQGKRGNRAKRGKAIKGAVQTRKARKAPAHEAEGEPASH